MNAKLIAAVVATLVCVSAHAEQPYGRDSVYAGRGSVSSSAASGPAIAKYGRDSVYATGTPVRQSQPTMQAGDFSYKFGRA
ncbi:MAG: hypothetical protein ABI612_06430 [Betaproteobacteria bacterium]